MNAKHTRGPWKVHTDDENCGIYTVHAKESIYPDNDEANARLIAAAPELLKELEAALEIIEGEYPADDEIAAPVMKKIRAAIAKARGEA
jgi:hypothetical protein